MLMMGRDHARVGEMVRRRRRAAHSSHHPSHHASPSPAAAAAVVDAPMPVSGVGIVSRIFKGALLRTTAGAWVRCTSQIEPHASTAWLALFTLDVRPEAVQASDVHHVAFL